MRPVILLSAFLSLYPTGLLAKQPIAGRYVGTVQAVASGGRTVFVGVAFEIREIRGEIIKGTMAKNASWGKCKGEAAADCTLKQDKIAFQSVAELGAAGCGRPRISGVLNGDSFVGDWEGQYTKLSRQLPAAEGLVTW